MPEHNNRGLEPITEFDRLLRSSLETYADPGPDSRLAQRVLARIAAEGAREHTRRMIRWAIALPVAACVVAALVILVSMPGHHPAVQTNQARMTPPVSTDAGPSRLVANSPSGVVRRSVASRPLRHSSSAAAGAAEGRLPKLDVFPTPQPLTPEEKALVTYVAHVPEAERKSLVDAQKQMDAPLSIEALEIKPLEPPEPEGN
jgi:hypothetical protein